MLQRLRRVVANTTLGGLGAVALTVLLANGGDPEPPWPGGQPPSEAEVDDLVADALELLELERFEEYLEAFEKGEDGEHIFIVQEDIDEGMHDLDSLFLFGDAVFGHEFRKEDGYADIAEPIPLQRIHNGRRGGLDTFSCAGCHSVGGPDGSGTFAQNAFLHGDGDNLSSALVRNPPITIGLGFVQRLAAEMTDELHWQRTMALDEAASRDRDVTVDLISKNVSFGTLTASADGGVEYDVEGIDADLVVKPFGWKGKFVDIRRTVEDAARVHFGIQSHVLALEYQEQRDEELLGPGPNWWDPDGDGEQRELEEGALTAAAVYLAMLESPMIIPPSSPQLRDRWAKGGALFDQVGCDECHRRSMNLLSGTWEEYPDTTGGPPVVVNLVLDGEGPKSGLGLQIFSDLKRHDMGPELADPRADDLPGVAPSVWLTRPLWGLAETAPYLHDGRAPTIPDAILAHGGEAQESRDAFAALGEDDQANIHLYLLSLTRQPKVRVPL